MYDLCRHLLASGRRCTQPAVTGTPYCRHHRVVKRTIADSVLPPQFHNLHKAIPFVYPEDRAAIQANCFLVLRALDDRRINTQTANAMGRLLRTCEVNLKRGPLHGSNGESASRPNSKTEGDAVGEQSDPGIVRSVVLTPAGEEIAPPREVWEAGEDERHGEECPCRRCKQLRCKSALEQHHPDCQCGECPQNSQPDSDRVDHSEHSSCHSDRSEHRERSGGTCTSSCHTDAPCLKETSDKDQEQKPAPCVVHEPDTATPSKDDWEQESERRRQIINKHKHRFTEMEKEYQYSPDLADRTCDLIQEIMELEMGPENFRYQLPPSAS